MKIQIMSDLHILHWAARQDLGTWQEFQAQTQTDADVLVLAGDIVDLRPGQLNWSMTRLLEFAVRYKNIIYVPGNHEYYGTSISTGLLELLARERDIPGFHTLYSGHSVTIRGQRLLGDTMWQPSSDLKHRIGDHYYIEYFHEEVPLAFEDFQLYLEDQLRADDIVVSHHAPSNKSITKQWESSPLNRWFATPEIEPLILERQPKLWIHGHMHSALDYQLGDTRVLCNPRGYPGEAGTAFNPQLVIDVP